MQTSRHQSLTLYNTLRVTKMEANREINNPQSTGTPSATLPGKSTRRSDTTELTYMSVCDDID